MKVLVFLESFKRWASLQPDIEAVALVGSYACDAATEGSDVDLIILSSSVAAYLSDQSWMSLFGVVTDCQQEDWHKVISLRTFYEGGLEVEYGFSTSDWARVPADPGTLRVISDGMKILYDPQDILAKLRQSIVVRK